MLVGTNVGHRPDHKKCETGNRVTLHWSRLVGVGGVQRHKNHQRMKVLVSPQFLWQPAPDPEAHRVRQVHTALARIQHEKLQTQQQQPWGQVTSMPS